MTAANLPILLVEDDENDVLLIRRAFSRAGIANPLEIARDGDQALDYLAGDGPYRDRQRYPLPAVVLLDLKLPRRSGLEVLAWLRGQLGLRRLPVVVLTSSNDRGDINRAYDLGANSYLVKPVALGGLLGLVDVLNGYWLGLNEGPELEGGAG